MDREQNVSNRDPLYHMEQVKALLTELIDHLRADVFRVDDPKAQALFETSAEVVLGLRKAFIGFEQRSHAAWKKAR